MSDPNKRHRIVQDDDGHTYVIPVGSEKEFHAWYLAMEAGADFEGADFSDYRVNMRLSAYTFADPKVEL